MNPRVYLLVALTAAALGGCASTTPTLNVNYAEAQASRGPLSSVEPRRFDIAVNDKRPDIARIGYKCNGLKTGDILSSRPVPDIVRDALVVELQKNGHLLAKDGQELSLAVDVTEFWFDLNIGTVGMTLTVADRRTGALLLTQRYQGTHWERSVFYVGTCEGAMNAMNAALERMIRDLATDPKLVQALKAR